MNKNFRKWMVLSSIIIFVFLISTAGRGLSPLSARRFSIEIIPPPQPICINQDYPVTVFIQMAERQFSEIVKTKLTGLPIEATVKNPSVGIISPQKVTPGVLPDFDENNQTPKTAVFSFHANQIGTTDIFFESVIPEAKNDSTHGYTSSTLTIEVVPCYYALTAVSYMTFEAPNLLSVVTATTTGEMRLVGNSTIHFEGEAETEWNAFSYSDGCSHEHKLTPGTAYFVGDMGSDDNLNPELTIQIRFDTVQYASENCASSNSGKFDFAKIQLTVPAIGAVYQRDTPLQWGREQTQGWTIISVIPISAK